MQGQIGGEAVPIYSCETSSGRSSTGLSCSAHAPPPSALSPASQLPPRGRGRKCTRVRWAPRAEGRAEMTQAAPEAAPLWGCRPRAAAAGPGLYVRRGRAEEGALRPPRRCWPAAPRAVCLSLRAGAMAAERTRPLRGFGGPSAPSRCEPGARSRAPGRSLRSVLRGTRLWKQGTWERRTGWRDLELILEMGKLSLGVTAS